MIGRTVGNYVVKQKIGEGGMGAVYLAEHPRIHRQVAIKVLLPEFSKNSQVVARFFNEAKAANEIHNEHIIDIIDFGELSEGGSYIIMEWLDGKSLSSALAAGAFPLGRAVHIARGIARALGAAHARGIVHRDLKPDNIFLILRNDDPDFVKVLDFGIAKLMAAESAGPDVKTKTGSLIGTPSYMSPEQCRGADVDHRTDIYALGVLLYQMLTGTLPFVAEGLGELLLAHMTKAPVSPRVLAPSLPVVVEQAVLRALEKDPALRFQTVDGLLDAIDGVKTGKRPAAPAGAAGPAGMDAPTQPGAGRAPAMDTLARGAGEQISPTVGRRRPTLIAGAAVGLALAGGIIFFLQQQQRPETPPRPGVVVSPPPPPPRADDPRPTPKIDEPPKLVAATAHVTIRVEPTSATVTLDGAPLANPFTGNFPRGDTRHRVAASAPGFHGESQWITFEGDRAVELKLREDKAGKRPPPVVVKVGEEKKPPPDGKPVYKGTKSTLITDYPDEK